MPNGILHIIQEVCHPRFENRLATLRSGITGARQHVQTGELCLVFANSNQRATWFSAAHYARSILWYTRYLLGMEVGTLERAKAKFARRSE